MSRKIPVTAVHADNERLQNIGETIVEEIYFGVCVKRAVIKREIFILPPYE